MRLSNLLFLASCVLLSLFAEASQPTQTFANILTVQEGATHQFTALFPANWSASCGSITTSGDFTAPLQPGTCMVTATATDGSGDVSRTLVGISSPITITPISATISTTEVKQFTASAAVNWSASCGSITSTGLYTAPTVAKACVITATASSGTAYVTTAPVIVTAQAALNYTTWKNDNARDGLQEHETTLTPANVNSASFGTTFTATVDDSVWAQPLYMSGVSIGGTTHNVVYVATANDSVYAIDGDSGAQLWHVNLLGTGEAPGNGKTLHSSLPKIGVTGTPVIDPETGTLYAVSQSVSSAGSSYHRLHALDITTGAERFGGPVVVQASGWDSAQHLQRPGLLLANGRVYFAFGSNQDMEPFHGWIFAYDPSTLAQITVWNDTASAEEGGVWMGAAGLAADKNGSLFVATANGDWDGKTQFGQSVVKLSYGLTVLDYFTPYDHVNQSAGDKDLGSGGVLLLPDLAGAHPHMAVPCSKLNTIYLLDRDHLGGVGTTSDNVVQQVTGQLGGTSGTQYTDRCFSTATFWNNNLYFIGNNDVLKQFSFNPSSGTMSTTPVKQDVFEYLFPGGQPVVSSNGDSNAIVWSIDWTTGTLRANQATDVSKVLYVSPKLGTGIKFTVPTVVNGHVYVGLINKVVGLGLLPGTACAPPKSAGVTVCAPVAGQSYASPVVVTAGGTAASGSVNHMELWIDGTKIGDYTGNEIRTTVALAAGSHSLTAIEVDSTGAAIKSTPVSFTVE